MSREREGREELERAWRRWLRKKTVINLTIIGVLLGFAVGAAAIVSQLSMEVETIEPLVVGAWNATFPDEIYPGESRAYGFWVNNSAPVAYGVKYWLNVSVGSGVNATIRLLVNGEEVNAINVIDGGVAQFEGRRNIGAEGSHRVAVVVNPSPESPAGKTISIDVEISRLAPS